MTENTSYYVAFTPDPNQSQYVHGVSPALASRIAGVGAVQLVSEVDGHQAVVYLNDTRSYARSTISWFSDRAKIRLQVRPAIVKLPSCG